MRMDDRMNIVYLVFGEFARALGLALEKDPKDEWLRFTWATCLLHLERYQEAVAAYEEAMAKNSSWPRQGLEAARLGQQPDWAGL